MKTQSVIVNWPQFARLFQYSCKKKKSKQKGPPFFVLGCEGLHEVVWNTTEEEEIYICVRFKPGINC